MPSPLFESTSPEKPSLLTVSFKDDPSGSLGAQLVNLDKSCTMEMFVPGYAMVGKLLEGDTVGRKSGVKVGDCLVAVNGEGFRRFAPDFAEDELEHLSAALEETTLNDDESKKMKDRVVHNKPGENYTSLLEKIKTVKKAGDPPLVLSLERHGWDTKVHSWARFLAARNDKVPEAMMMMQEHEAWKTSYFPIDLTGSGLQDILKLKAVSEVDVSSSAKDNDQPPCVYVNYSKLQSLQDNHNPDDVVQAFVIFTEIMLGRSDNCRQPKTCQFIDLSGVSVTAGFRVDVLKKIYAVFEPNYPETLAKMVLYPVSKMVASTSKALLGFVNEDTRKKFIITDSLETVCTELGWDQKEVEEAGGVTDFVHKHEKEGDSMIF